jgi:hypothetical protein
VTSADGTAPGVRRLTATAASGTLQAAGFVLGQVTTAPDYTCNHLGVIMWQNPAADTLARFGSPVRVTVGVPALAPCPWPHSKHMTAVVGRALDDGAARPVASLGPAAGVSSRADRATGRSVRGPGCPGNPAWARADAAVMVGGGRPLPTRAARQRLAP